MNDLVSDESLQHLEHAAKIIPVALGFGLFVLFGWAYWKYVVRPMLDWSRDNPKSKDDDK